MTLIELVTDALSKVNDPELRHPITELGMIEDLSESSGAVSLKVLLTIAACPMQDRLRTDISLPNLIHSHVLLESHLEKVELESHQ
jgi:ATP-binding protein involved in chromosome partitioning